MECVLSHPLYSTLTNLSNIRIFMENHIFSVWTFMILLHNLIDRLSPVEGVWTPPLYHRKCLKTLREIWIEEELDDAWDGIPQSHTSLYLQAMKEVNASTSAIDAVISFVRHTPSQSPVNLIRELPLLDSTKDFVLEHFALLDKGAYSFEEIFLYFMYGRELLIPSMFSSIRQVLTEQNLTCPIFTYYIERHIDLDLHHGYALRRQSLYIKDQGIIERMKEKAYQDRIHLWDGIYQDIQYSTRMELSSAE